MPRFKHEAWHTLFDNFSVLKTLDLFQDFCSFFGTDNKKSRRQIGRDREWIRAKPSRIIKKQAWETLFHGLSLEQIVSEVNLIWLDPDYKIVILNNKYQTVALARK